MKINYWQKFEPGHYYHIYNHSVDRSYLFTTKEDYKDFLLKHFKYLDCAFETIAYCLMPNHFHFVIKVRSEGDIKINAKQHASNKSLDFQKGIVTTDSFILDQYRRFFSSYSLSFNYRFNRKGQLFLKRFKRVSFLPEQRLAYLVCYLHHNPIHHGFTNDYKSWRHNSYAGLSDNYKSGAINQTLSEYLPDIESYNRAHRSFKVDYNLEHHLE